MLQNRDNIPKIIEILNNVYGKKVWKQSNPPLDILIKTILSQNTSDVNSFRAFDMLKSKFPNWQDCEMTPTDEIENYIKIGGLAKTKSKRIKEILKIIKNETKGSFNLDFLKDYSVDRARNWLLSLKGVGEKTAACTLIFGFNKSIFPVDTHILRISKRLGLISNITLEKAHTVLKEIIPKKSYYEAHLNFIEHGRKICHSINPNCKNCKISEYCFYYNKLLILQVLGEIKKEEGIDEIAKKISDKIDINKILGDLERDQLISITNNNLINITNLGVAFININKSNKQETIKNLIKSGYNQALIIKLFKITRKKLNSFIT